MLINECYLYIKDCRQRHEGRFLTGYIWRILEEDSVDWSTWETLELDTYIQEQIKNINQLMVAKDAVSWRLFGGKEWNMEYILFCLLQ